MFAQRNDVPSSEGKDDQSDGSSTPSLDLESSKETNSSLDQEEIVFENGSAPEGQCSSSDPPVKDDIPTLRPRSYQSEMYEKSLKENIIVAVCRHWTSRNAQLIGTDGHWQRKDTNV